MPVARGNRPAPTRPVAATRPVCAITGASGYVGSRVASRLVEAGWEVRVLARSRPGAQPPGPGHIDFELGDAPAAATLAGAEALVHAAYDFSAIRWREIQQINVEGSRRLFLAARDAGVERVVLVSTVAAFPGARSLYGRAKLEIERAAIGAGAAVVRPGLVWGPRGTAMFGALRHAVRYLPVVPLLVPAELELSLVHEDDLALLVERLLARWPTGSGEVLVAAAVQTTPFVELLRSLAPRADRGPRLLRLPWRAVWLGLRALEALGANPPFRSDSLLGLVAADEHPLARATANAERYGVSFRPYLPARTCRS